MNKLPLALPLLGCLPALAQWIPNYSAQPVDSITETTTWATAVSSTEQVAYGSSTRLSLYSPLNTTLSTSRSVTLTGWLDGVKYYWRPISKDVTNVPVYGALTTFVTAPIVVTVSPATATVASGQSQQFTATVSGVSNQSVTWSASAGAITVLDSLPRARDQHANHGYRNGGEHGGIEADRQCNRDRECNRTRHDTRLP